jgi:ArsR family transcriptional regulator, arsenate/arsenite/antimonite-responsive transcriptional repressor
MSVFGEIPTYWASAMNDTFHAMSDPTRREILRLLRVRDMTAGEISEEFKLARSTLSGHCNVLKHAGLIVAEKHGTSIVYSLNVSVVEETIAAVLDMFKTASQRKGAKKCKRIGAMKPSNSS